MDLPRWIMCKIHKSELLWYEQCDNVIDNTNSFQNIPKYTNKDSNVELQLNKEAREYRFR